MPPGTPPGTGYEQFDDPYGEPEPDEQAPWFQRPLPLALLVLVLVAVGGLVAWLLLGGDDDEVASADSTLVTFEVRDEAGDAIDTGIIIGVNGPPEAPAAYTWLRPSDATPGEIAGNGTGDDGRVEFEWEPDAAAVDPATWAATVTLAQPLPAGWTPPEPLIECSLRRGGATESVTMSAEVDNTDATVDRVVNYSFPNSTFLAGDTVDCEVSVARPAVEATTTVAPTTTVTDTTTTAPATTTTTPATTTTSPATTTTTPVITVPPQPEATLWDVIDRSPGLTELKALIETAGLEGVLQDPTATITLFAPSNQAIEDAVNVVPAPDVGDPAVVTPLLLAHVNDAEVLLLADVLELTEVPVVQGGPQPVDAGAGTVGGALVIQADVTASNGVIQVIDAVMPIQP